jgi:methyl-accepting chemotaxis protein
VTVRDRLKGAITRAIRHDGAQGRSSLDDALLFEAQERALRAAETAVRLSQGAGATAAQQKSALDAAADQARMLVARGRDARGPVQQVRDTLERAKLVCLNAGLEGARLGEPAGKALVSIADELRSLATRSLEAVDELGSMQSQVEQDREKLLERIEQAQQRARELSEELLRSQASQRDAETALGELGKTLAKTSATDPDTARALSAAAEHARGLLSTLATLSARRDRGTILSALGPALRPLLDALRELYRGRPRQEQP